MESTQAYIDPFHDPRAGTLAEALSRFEAMPDESPSRKARARAAVALAGRLLRKAPEEISAQATYLTRQLAKFKHKPTGLSAKSIANCRCEIVYMLEKVCGKGHRSRFRPLSGEWRALRDTFGQQPCIWKLSRFMAFCSAEGIAPGEVNDQTVTRFRNAVLSSEEVEHPDAHVRTTITAWNEIARSATEMTQLTVAPRRIARWTIEPQKFPASFRAEVDAWLDGLSKVDPEAEEGPIRALRPASLKLRRHQVFKAASALVFSGRSIESITSISCLVEIDGFKVILKTLRERQGGKKSLALHNLAIALKYVAKHHVRVSQDHLDRLSRLCANQVMDDRELSKSQKRLEAFDDERQLGALLNLPGRLLEEAAHPRASATKARQLAQTAIALEIEFHAPMRLKNLATLNLNKIQTVIVGGEKRWAFQLDRDETKNHNLVAYEVPATSVRLIERAMKYYTCDNGWLFPGSEGNHKSLQALAAQVVKTVETRLGCKFNVHMLRGLAARIQVTEDDNGFEKALAFLGNSSGRVIREHYTATANKRLIRTAQDTVQRVRVRTAPIVQHRA